MESRREVERLERLAAQEARKEEKLRRLREKKSLKLAEENLVVSLLILCGLSIVILKCSYKPSIY